MVNENKIYLIKLIPLDINLCRYLLITCTGLIMATNTLLLTIIMYCENCLQGNLIDGALEEVILILNKQRQ